MWVYRISTGQLLQNGLLMGSGYSGLGDAKNDPKRQDDKGEGPIPEGKYAIGPMIAHHGAHGPCVLPLTPIGGQEMHGRSAFLIHGDSIEHPGTASHGCIIMSRTVRQQIAASLDKDLFVVANPSEAARLDSSGVE